jgi:hypothetical protein
MDQTNSLSKSFSHLSVGDQDTPSLTRVSCERDHFTDSDHNLLDAKLMRHFSAFQRFNEVPELPALLSILTLGDKRLVTFAEEEAEELLTKQPSINPVLQKAWKNSSFKEIRQLSEFFVATQLLFVPLTTIEGDLWPVVQTRRWFSALCYWDW